MMLQMQSNEIDQLITAFVEARKQSQRVECDGKANYGKYVTIGEIKACTNDALLANGLSLTQSRTFVDGHVLLVTKLSHVSGQWQCSYVPLFIEENPKNIQQAYGAAMSYQRRYELYGWLSILGDDIDPDSIASEQPTNVQSDCINDKQLSLLRFKLKGKEALEPKLCEMFKIQSLAQLPRKYMDKILEVIGE